MEFVWVILIGILSLYVCLSPIIHAKPETPEALPAYIPKQRPPSRAAVFHDWDTEYYALLREKCKKHYGRENCLNCGTVDNSTPSECNCDSIVQMNACGDIILIHRINDSNCIYHIKEHYFETT